MLSVDLNCDLGEGSAYDAQIMPFISSSNIACGFHAGNEQSMMRTIELALEHGVAIGAHPGFADKEHFGRRAYELSEDGYYRLLIEQLIIINNQATSCGATLHHVKPHGALYNISAKNKQVARLIAKAVHDFDKKLILYGLSGSYSISEAAKYGLRTANEVFADRTYQNDGSLTDRDQPNALINSVDKALNQVLQMIEHKTVQSIYDITLFIETETICIHGDGAHAVEFARQVNLSLLKNQILIKPVS
jgi:UPF0271 protein